MRLWMSCLALLVLVAPRAAAAQSADRFLPGTVAPLPPRARPDPRLLRWLVLQQSLDGLAQRDRTRAWSGWLQIGGGLVLGGLAPLAEQAELRGMLGLTSLVALGHGIVELRLDSGAEQILAELAQLAPQDLDGRLRRAEQGLREAAVRSRRERIVGGSLTMFGAVAFVPLSYGLARLDDPDHRFGNQALDYVGLSLSVIGFASGLVHALVKSPAERSYAQYRELPR